MSRIGMRKYEFYLHPDAAEAILQASCDRDVELNKALNQIIREWIEYKEIEDVITSNTAISTSLQKALEDETLRRYQLLRQRLNQSK